MEFTMDIYDGIYDGILRWNFCTMTINDDGPQHSHQVSILSNQLAKSVLKDGQRQGRLQGGVLHSVAQTENSLR